MNERRYRRRTRRVALLVGAVAALVVCAAGAAACGSSRRAGFDGLADAASDSDPGPGFTEGAVPCQGLACKRASCDPGKETTLTGKVYDPRGANALYNVMVYIPGGNVGDGGAVDLPPIPEGVGCETCAGIALSPLASALSDTAGSFVLKDVPVGDDIPVVIQVGKWRRTITVDIEGACASNEVPDKELRLPRNGSEGDMPQIAVTSGGCDALECLLKGIGIDDSELVAGPGGPGEKGHVHVFNGDLGTWPGAPAAQTLWGDVNAMLRYDITLLSCECSEATSNKANLLPVRDYVNAGGRLFATHYHYLWMKSSPDDAWRGLATWSPSGAATESDVNTTFPKGDALAEWLVNVGASTTKGKVSLSSVTGELANVSPPSQSWILNGENAVRYFSFNAPLDKPVAEQCGRAVYGDLHLMGSGNACLPGSSTVTTLSPQQKALEFMFFDLAACVQDDKTPPSPPK